LFNFVSISSIKPPQAPDQEVSVLSLATLANILSFVDSILLADNSVVEAVGAGIPQLIDHLRSTAQKPQRLYAAACIANASYHPRLAALLNQQGGGFNSLNVFIYTFLFIHFLFSFYSFLLFRVAGLSRNRAAKRGELAYSR
jgi:hypothetical protein